MSNNSTLVILSIFGLVLGAGLVYVYYRPEIIQLQNEILTLEENIESQTMQISELQNTIESLEDENDKMHSTYTSLSIEYEQITNRYNVLLNNYLLLLSSYSYPIFIPTSSYQDFLKYIEIDPNNAISKTSNRVTWDHMDRSITRSLSTNYQQYSDTFIHQFSFTLTDVEGGDNNSRAIIHLWNLKDENVSLWLDAQQIDSTDDVFTLIFYQQSEEGNIYVEGNNIFVFKSQTLSTNVVYSVRLLGQNNIYRVQVWDGVSLVVDSDYQHGVSADYNLLTLVQVGVYNDDFYDWSSGYLEYLQILN